MASAQKREWNKVQGSFSLNCRQILTVMVFFGFMFNYMLRVNINIAIVDMIRTTSNSTTNQIEIAGHGNSTAVTDSNHFDWDVKSKNVVLGSFFWGYLLTEIPGGRMAEVFGPRRVLGYSMLLSSLLTLVTPLVASWGYLALSALRALIGFLLGVTWPSMLPMAAKWIPPADRSKFMSNMMASSLGAAFTTPVCGFMIAGLGWESTFYATGLVAFVWTLLWFALIYDSPAQHPRISKQERDFIESAIPNSGKTNEKHPSVPWIKVLTSGPVWAIILTHVASIYGFFTILNQLPTYMKDVLGKDIKQNGLLSGLPFLGKYIMALSTGFIADWLKSTGKLNTTKIRKLFTTMAVGIPGLLMWSLVYLGQTSAGVVIIMTLTLTFNGAVTAGYLGNGLDIAPNFSGTIFGIANMLSSIGGYMSTYMVGSLTKDAKTFESWRIVFWILGGTYIFGAIMYLILGSGELQFWNDPNSRKPKNADAAENGRAESVPLKDNNS